MAAVDQSTRRGRLIVVFIGGLIIFGGLMLGGLYLSHQRKAQFEASQNGDSTQITNEETKDTAEIADKPAEEGSTDGETNTDSNEVSEATPDADEAPSRGEEDNEAVAGSSGATDDGEIGTGQSLPATGPSGDGAPSEIPATGPEAVWIVAIIGAIAAAYASFEYRRSRLAFRRAAMQRE